MKKFVFAILLLAALGAGAYFLKDHLPSGPSVEAKPAFPVVKVARRDIDRSVDVSGFVEPLIATEVKSEVSGKIKEIYVENGSRVKKGDRLVVLDATLAQADYDEALRNKQITESTLEKNQRDYARLEKLHKEGFATERDMLDAKTALEQSKVSLEVQQSRIAKMKENLDKTTILAPHDGMVTNLDLNPGQVVIGAGSVNSGTTLLKVNDLSQLIVQANLNEFDVAKIEMSTPAQLTFDSLPEMKVTGKLFYISPSGLSSSASTTTSLSTALRVFPIKVSFSTENLAVRPGISANIGMVISSVKSALSVPVSAVFIESNERIMFVQQPDKTFARTVVKTGINNDGFIEIIEGVGEGDEVSLIRPTERP